MIGTDCVWGAVGSLGERIKGYLYGYIVRGMRDGLSDHVYGYIGYCDWIYVGDGLWGRMSADGGVQKGIEADSSLIHYSNMHGVLSIWISPLGV